MSDLPVVLFQWQSTGDADEPTAIREALAKAETNPAGTSFVTSDSVARACAKATGAEVLAEFEAILKANDEAQIIYFSAHGAPGEKKFYNKNLQTIDFLEFGQCLGSLLKADCVVVVLGSCHAAACGIEKHLPDNVNWVWGFSKTPTAQDVINLMAAVTEDYARLFEAMRAANTAYTNALNAKGDANVAAEEFFGPVLASHVPEIAVWFKSKSIKSGELWVRERDASAPGGWSQPKTVA